MYTHVYYTTVWWMFTGNVAAFKLAYGHYDTSTEGRVKFDTVALNHGNRYNTDTNLFTSPYSGLYTFIAQVCDSNLVGFWIRTNGVIDISSARIYDHSELNCATTTGVTDLDKGDEVDVYINGEIRRFSTNQFAGDLIRRYYWLLHRQLYIRVH